MREHETSKRSLIEMMRRLPTQEELDQNLRHLNELLGIDEADYGKIELEDLQKRIKDRISQQNNFIYPQRVAEGKITPEWRRYASKYLDVDLLPKFEHAPNPATAV